MSNLHSEERIRAEKIFRNLTFSLFLLVLIILYYKSTLGLMNDRKEKALEETLDTIIYSCKRHNRYVTKDSVIIYCKIL